MNLREAHESITVFNALLPLFTADFANIIQTKMNGTLLFKIFCLESYKTAHSLSGHEVFLLFCTYKVFDYITKNYEVLHSFGEKYLVQDIDEFVTQRR